MSALIYLAIPEELAAQADSFCATEETGPQPPPPPPQTDCFNVDSIITDCTPVYVKANFHFFLNDDCGGSLDPNPGNTGEFWLSDWAYEWPGSAEGYGHAERVIREMNDLMENNQVQAHSGATEAPCVPLRFVLGDVLFHCVNDDRVFGTNFDFTHYNEEYGSNAPPGMNIYYVWRTDGASGEGNTYGLGLQIASLWSNLTLHEFGHNFTLDHTFVFNGNDGCSDTPNESFPGWWDRDCDGLSDYNEQNWPCWETLPATDPWCTGKLCNGTIQYSPCCDEANIYNNFMGYNGSQNAITACQIRRMLTALGKNFPCDIIAQVGGECPPPSPVLGVLPLDLVTEDCSFCLQGNASMNDEDYKLQIFELPVNSTPILFHSTGWEEGPAGKFCFSGAHGFLYGMKSNTNYQAVLTVKNACDVEKSVTIEFETPDFDCSEPNDPNGGHALQINPNPGSSQITATITLQERSPIWLMATPTSYAGQSQMLHQSVNQNEGASSVNFSVASWSAGVYSIRLVSSYGIINQQFIKQ